MFTSIKSGAVSGIEGRIVTVEADISDGFPSYALVGYLASEVKEAKERVTSALKNSGYRLPAKKIIVNLSPAGMRKQGTAYDLPIALAILGSLGILKQEKLKGLFAVGELSLDGSLRPIKGILSLILMANRQGIRRCMVPLENKQEALLIAQAGKDSPEIIGVNDLATAVAYLMGKNPINGQTEPFFDEPTDSLDTQENLHSSLSKQTSFTAFVPDFAEIEGQEILKRAIIIAVAGMHHFLMIGPPGCGKSMSAQAMRGILPPLTFEESLEVTQLYSVAGMLGEKQALIRQRPFRSPHHTVPIKTMTGGGSSPMPGEVSLAHRGILFLDEFAEFPPQVLEVLRQPMEEGTICLNRLQGNVTYPAKFMLVAAMNPCKCGYWPDHSRCRCNPQSVQRYQQRISRPLWDRIDLCAEVHPPISDDFDAEKLDSKTMSEKIQKARLLQEDRYHQENLHFNSELKGNQIKKYCLTSAHITMYAENLAKIFNLSMRGKNKLLVTARTIADVEGSSTILEEHLDEAVTYRTLESKTWEQEMEGLL